MDPKVKELKERTRRRMMELFGAHWKEQLDLYLKDHPELENEESSDDLPLHEVKEQVIRHHGASSTSSNSSFSVRSCLGSSTINQWL